MASGLFFCQTQRGATFMAPPPLSSAQSLALDLGENQTTLGRGGDAGLPGEAINALFVDLAHVHSAPAFPRRRVGRAGGNDCGAFGIGALT
jgi:hypothetical protein